MINLADTLDRFVAPSLRTTEDKKLLFRARISVGITLMYFSSQLSLALLLLVFGYLEILVWWPAVFSCAFSAACYLFQIMYFKKTGNLSVASTITMAILFFFTSRFIYITGGWNSPVILFLFVVPMCAFLVMGHKWGAVWSILSIAVYGSLSLLAHAGIAAPQVLPAEYDKLLQFFTWVFSWFMIVGGVMLYSGIVNSLNDSINNEKERIRHKATFDEESGAYTRKVFNQLLHKKIQAPETGIKSFALVLMELIPAHNTATDMPRREMLKILFGEIKRQLGDKAVISRYGNLSMTALTSCVEGDDMVRQRLDNLYQALQQQMNPCGATFCLGAVIVPNGFSDVNAMTDDARKALHQAKTQALKWVVYMKDEKRKKEQDYLSRAVIGPFDRIIKKS